MNRCPDCGSKVYDGYCTWCDEVKFIVDQYLEDEGCYPESLEEELRECKRRRNNRIRNEEN